MADINFINQNRDKKDKNSVGEKKYSHNAFFIGLISFFGGISQDIFAPILPLYLANVLNLDKSFIGLTEGLVKSSASIFKVVSGFLSDKFRRRKPIIFLGYFLSLVGRLFLAFATSGAGILALRFTDGAGKGMKDSPKDALIADSTERSNRGKKFGLVRALDTLGSVAGPLLLFLLLYLLKENKLKYHYIFFATAFPLAITLSLLSLFVKETPYTGEKSQVPTSKSLPLRFYVFLGVMTVFSMGNSSEAFLILRAQNVGVSLLAIPLVYAFFNFFYAFASIPLGSLSDKIGRERVILLGWLSYASAYFGFAFASRSYQIWILFVLYGVYYATAEGVAKAFIADLVSSERRGRAYGIYNAAVGLMALPASAVAGFLWDKYNPSAPFLFGGGLAVLAILLLAAFKLFYRPNKVKLVL